MAEFGEKYWENWPLSSCEYVKDLTWAAKVSADYLKKIAPRYRGKNPPLIVTDFDDCLVYGSPETGVVKEMELGYVNGQDVFILPPNKPIVNLMKLAKSLGFKIVVLTARPSESKLATITNLNMFDIPYDSLIMNEDDTDPLFKINIRRKLCIKQQVVLTIGDQYGDVLLPGKNCASVKLPEPDSKASYIYIPPGV